ncbi:MAG: LysM peptidoglycan-binding domain-containing protein, partial [Duncaniella sp.]|nr:LysM peptidoglycan-binding domain-containing protein [Duncaniella sp.]
MAAIASHADVKDLPVRKVNGKLYHYYEVPAKETVYSLCYKLGITKDQLVKDNPAVADGLKSGMTLFFPHESENSENTKNLANPGRIINHKVEKGETIYGIARKYGTSTDRI